MAESNSDADKRYELAAERFRRLLDIVHTLRLKCPWDSVQTPDTLRECLLEEAYEVLDALDRRLPDRVCEEVGDLVMVVALHCIMASEAGDFDIADSLESINEKLVRRHPHVFGDTEVDGTEEVLVNWEAIKRVEKADEDRFAGVPDALPALLRAARVRAKMKRAGYRDASVVDAGMVNVLERIQSVVAAQPEDGREVFTGRLLAGLVGVLSDLGVKPEDALRCFVTESVRRFHEMESELRSAGGEGVADAESRDAVARKYDFDRVEPTKEEQH